MLSKTQTKKKLKLLDEVHDIHRYEGTLIEIDEAMERLMNYKKKIYGLRFLLIYGDPDKIDLKKTIKRKLTRLLGIIDEEMHEWRLDRRFIEIGINNLRARNGVKDNRTPVLF